MGVFELNLKGTVDGNPFADIQFAALFKRGDGEKEIAGFYDGRGNYRLRFMPAETGKWTYETRSNCEELDGRRGSFLCTAPSPENHGPLSVCAVYHFRYADGAPYYPVGTIPTAISALSTTGENPLTMASPGLRTAAFRRR